MDLSVVEGCYEMSLLFIFFLGNVAQNLMYADVTLDVTLNHDYNIDFKHKQNWHKWRQ